MQIFESWAEGLSEPLFWRLIIEPTRKLVGRLRELGVSVPIIGFPRGSGALLGAYAQETGVTAIGVDTQTPPAFARAQAPKNMPLQGNLDPQALVAGGDALERAVRETKTAFRGSPHIFNLGHGITPNAKPENVARLVELVKGVALSLAPTEDDEPERERVGPRIMTTRRVAVILFNLGGPDSRRRCSRFLFNLFNDRAIIDLPNPWRFLLAKMISGGRAKMAAANYQLMGGGSPILPETEKQARALEQRLTERVSNVTFSCFPAMRYWKPFVEDAARDAEHWHATDAVLLPLYPQYSSTTTASSLKAWNAATDDPAPRTLCCYPAGADFAQAHADQILKAWKDAGSPAKPRVLFSAHGLPQKVINAGDPYQWQVERTAWAMQSAAARRLGHAHLLPIARRPLEMDRPIDRARNRTRRARQNWSHRLPIAFVSEHVETLVELDLEYGSSPATLACHSICARRRLARPALH